MAFPPATIDADKANGTVMATDHPAHHNELAEAINDTVTYLTAATTRNESVTVEVFAAATAVTTGDGKKYFRIPSALNGMNLSTCGAGVFAKSTSGNPTVQIARGRQSSATSAHSFVDMLSTAITIDANDYDSKDAGTPPAINTSNDDVATGDLIRIDVDTAGTGTTGLFVTLGFLLP